MLASGFSRQTPQFRPRSGPATRVSLTAPNRGGCRNKPDTNSFASAPSNCTSKGTHQDFSSHAIPNGIARQVQVHDGTTIPPDLFADVAHVKLGYSTKRFLPETRRDAKKRPERIGTYVRIFFSRPRRSIRQKDRVEWWAHQDLNLGPIRYERTALTS
jgi:hypothetical protein